MRKKAEDEIETYHRAMAESAVDKQRKAQAGSEMELWVNAGHLGFIKERVLVPLRNEYVEAIQSAKWVAATVPQVANMQGFLTALSVVEARVNAIIQTGKNAIAELEDLQNSTLQGESE